MQENMNKPIEPLTGRTLASNILVILLIFAGAGQTSAGTMSTWGLNAFGETNVPPGLTNVVAIASGDFHGLALKSDGTVVAWGDNRFGQTNVPTNLSGVVAVAAGGGHSLALKSDGTVVAWGADFLGPTIVPPGLSNVLAIGGGSFHSLALKSDGTVVVWSSDTAFSGDLGATNVPAGLSNVVAIATGGGHHCLVARRDGTVFGWGDNNAGSVTGVPSGPPYYAAGEVILGGQLLSNVVAVAAGNHPSLALKSDGTVMGWPDQGTAPAPAGLSNVVAIAAGAAKNLALKSDGTVVEWGFGMLPPELPVPPDLNNVVAIAVENESGLVLLDDSAPFDGCPFIIQHPLNCTANLGASTLFVVGAIGAVPLSYQWQLNETNIDGATSPALLLTNVTLPSAGSYRCVVSNAHLAVTSSPAILSVLRPTLQFDTSPAACQFTNGGFGLRLMGLSGHGAIVIYSSTDLINWNAIFTNPPIVGNLQFLDSSPTNLPSRFYRAEEK
jgi:alpha-tubulin suppressor-like RCC1 family protein